MSVTAFLSNICCPPKNDGFWKQEEKTRREKDMGTKVTLVHTALLLLIETGTKYKKKPLKELWAGYLMSGWSSGTWKKLLFFWLAYFPWEIQRFRFLSTESVRWPPRDGDNVSVLSIRFVDLTKGFRSASPTVTNLPYELSVDKTKFAATYMKQQKFPSKITAIANSCRRQPLVSNPDHISHWELFFQNRSRKHFPPIVASMFVKLKRNL